MFNHGGWNHQNIELKRLVPFLTLTFYSKEETYPGATERM